MKQILFWGIFIRLTLESCMELFLNSLQNLLRPRFTGPGEVLSVLLSLLCLVLIPAMTFAFCYVGTKFPDSILRKQFNQRFGEFFNDFKQKNKLAVNTNSFFVLRRFLFSLSLVFLSRYLFLQLFLSLLSSSLFFIFIFVVQPYKKRLLNRLEIFNESCILVLNYFIVGFTDMQPDPKLKQFLGLLYCGFIILNFLSNIAFMVFVAVQSKRRKRNKNIK